MPPIVEMKCAGKASVSTMDSECSLFQRLVSRTWVSRTWVFRQWVAIQWVSKRVRDEANSLAQGLYVYGQAPTKGTMQ